jgi:hypothetical protein
MVIYQKTSEDQENGEDDTTERLTRMLGKVNDDNAAGYNGQIPLSLTVKMHIKTNKLCGLSPRANYTD